MVKARLIRFAVVVIVGVSSSSAGSAAGQTPGRGGTQTPAAGRGQARPECVNPVIPAAECGIWPGVNWPDPPLGPGPFLLQTAVPQHRNIRVVVVASGLNQPWSLAWLPDGTMLVTERAGRLRVIRNGVLDPAPVSGVPEVRAQGIQGLMDVSLHPRFAENHWVYLSYHKPFAVPGASAPGGGPLIEGETVLARGTLGRQGAHGCPRHLPIRGHSHRVVAHRLGPRRDALHERQRHRRWPRRAAGRGPE